ncbi:SHOCT domain-containing protein [Fodinibius sp. AD559]|uniref:SHOCT domain-containing protein n=1 Tax=Fodinibius sp. AD559 TaxID=3424179 RepID=UPI004046D7ED
MNSILLQMNGPQHMMDGWGGFGIGLMMVFWLLVLGLIVTLIWFLVRKGGESPTSHTGESSLEILKKRYARGEIDEDQYRRMKDEITE